MFKIKNLVLKNKRIKMIKRQRSLAKKLNVKADQNGGLRTMSSTGYNFTSGIANLVDEQTKSQ